jgi:outer membrane protein assembly factor BamB
VIRSRKTAPQPAETYNMPSRHAAALLGLLCLLPAARAADWPTWRFDSGRGAASPEQLPAQLHLNWVRVLPPLKPAWPDQPKLQFDSAYEPVVSGNTLFVGSSRTDSVSALDTATGAEKWRFHADGPVRFAPAVWEGRVYFVSDDGHLYCLDAGKGTLLWKFRGGPSDRRVLGNGRLVSAWPARGAPVLHEGKVYFAASIWPFMGVFLHALDAPTGRVVWTNDGDGSLYMKQPHNTDSFAGVAPHGYFVVSGDRLLIPGGRSVPACYDLKTGKLLRYQLAENGKRGGGAYVSATARVFFNGGAAFDVATQKFLGTFGEPVVLADGVGYTWSAGACRAFDLKGASVKDEETVDRKGKKVKLAKWKVAALGARKTPRAEALIKAGPRLYVGTGKKILALDLPLKEGAAPSWQAEVEGTVAGLVAADGRLFAVTREGRIYCFGGRKVEPVTHRQPEAPAAPADRWAAKVRAVLEATGVRDGYCVAWGAGSGRLVAELARQSNLYLVVVERSARKVSELREKLVAAGLYGERVAVHQGEPQTFPLPPYLASLMVAEDLHAAGVEPDVAFVRKAFHALRPYGGVACLPLETTRRADFAEAVGEAKPPGARFGAWGQGVLLTREGALPGAADWTHEHADESNTRVSKDTLVKAPLGVLWFGGVGHNGTLPRHGHGPQPQVIDGRLIQEGTNTLRAIDIYTGRLLWETSLPGVGAFYNNTLHQPGANSSGTNYISTRDGIYVAHGRQCVKLDPATGKRLAAFTLPAAHGAEPPRWGYINVAGDYLVGGADPLFDPKLAAAMKPATDPAPPDPDPPAKPAREEEKTKEKESALTKLLKKLRSFHDNLSSSKELVVLDRHTGKVHWRAQARSGFRHNAVCVGGGRLYAIDRLSGLQVARLKRRGEESKVPPRLVVFDLKTGKELWSTEADVFGTWLSYSAKHDVLVEAGRVARDTVADEPKGMRAYRAAGGKVLWYHKDYAGPAIIHGDTILKDQSACDLVTGAPTLRADPLTGRQVPWKWTRAYGCNTPMASEHLLTFRSGAAGYFDLCGDSGTGNFGGFRSGCTNNLVVAGGVLTAPDYTRTCVCSYQNQTSLALVPTRDNEMWTTYGTTEVKGTVRRVGINLGAPGDRRDESGTLWLEYPSTGGKSPAVPVKVAPAGVEWFRRHESSVEGGGLKWVAASGVKGVEAVYVALSTTRVKMTYTVRLHFLEPDRLPPGQRVFSVALQGKEVLKDFDIACVAGGPNRAVVREFRGVPVTHGLRVTLRPSPIAPVRAAVLCGIEVRAEE